MGVKEFFEMLSRIFLYPPAILDKAADALFAYQFEDLLLVDYLGYMHYAMGTPLFILFSTAALIGIAVALWSVIVKAIALIMEIIPLL